MANLFTQQKVEEILQPFGFQGQATGGAAEAFKQSNPQAMAAYNSAVKDATNPAAGVRTLDVASMNPYQKDSLYGMGQKSAPIDPRATGSYDKAVSSIDKASNPYDVQSYQKFMNPYTTDVVNTTRDAIVRSYDDSRTRSREELAAGGGFGSTALGQAYGDIEKNQNYQIGEQTSRLLSDGFDMANDRALNLYNTENNNNRANASAYLQTGAAYQGADAYGRDVVNSDATRQLYAGDRIQAQNQTELDAFYADRDRQLADANSKIATLGATLNAYPTGTTQTSIQSGNPWLSALGGATIGSSIGGTQTPLPWQTTGNVNPVGGYY
jgi:hypothetical protein